MHISPQAQKLALVGQLQNLDIQGQQAGNADRAALVDNMMKQYELQNMQQIDPVKLEMLRQNAQYQPQQLQAGLQGQQLANANTQQGLDFSALTNPLKAHAMETGNTMADETAAWHPAMLGQEFESGGVKNALLTSEAGSKDAETAHMNAVTKQVIPAQAKALGSSALAPYLQYLEQMGHLAGHDVAPEGLIPHGIEAITGENNPYKDLVRQYNDLKAKHQTALGLIQRLATPKQQPYSDPFTINGQ